MNYLEQIALDIWKATGGEGDTIPAEDAPLYLGYAVLALAKGKETTSKDVHDAWTAWATVRYTEFQHRCCVPFEELTPATQAYDDEYRDAIHQAAA